MHSDSKGWDDLRFVLAVAETGTVSAAARQLGVNHATVLRRVAAFEKAHGGVVFDRGPTGYAVRPDKVQVIEAARGAADAIRAVEALMQGAGSGAQGLVRVTSVDSLCQTVLAGLTGVQLLSSNAWLDLARLQADIAVRPAEALPADLEGESPVTLGFAIYGAVGLDEDAAWLTLTGPLARSRPARWMRDTLGDVRVAASSDSFLVLREMVRSGSGISILPCLLGDDTPGLERRDLGMPPMDTPIWVGAHRDVAESPRIRRMVRRISGRLEAEAARISGR